MRYWYDTEFLDTGSTIDLISIGVVAEDGREYYAQSVEFDETKASDWVKENVLKHLPICPCCGYKANHEDQPTGKCRSKKCMWRTREQMKRDVQSFIDPDDGIELWGWCAGYDFVAFCQLFGTMMDLPQGYPHYIREFQQVLDERGIADSDLPEQEEGLHNALSDAKHLQKLWGYIVRNDAWQ